MTHLREKERGNMLFMILLAVALIGALSAAITSSNNSESANIDEETLAIRASEVQRFASELERAVNYIMQDGKSEVDIRFSHGDAHVSYGDLSADSDKTDQVFHRDGGAANYQLPNDDILATSGQKWEFYGGTTIPQAGSNKPDLIAVLPNVTKQFCDKINTLNNQIGSTPQDTGSGSASGNSAGDCVNLGDNGRFGKSGGKTFYDQSSNTPNSFDETTFSKKPAMQACVQCEAGSGYHFYHVLMAR